MAKDLSKYILITDLDGTLLTADKKINISDLDAIKDFAAMGGYFSVATGRVYDSALPYIRQLPVNAPCILFNGGMVYDYNTEKILWKSVLPESSRKYAAEILNEFSSLGAEIIIDKKIYVPQFNDILREKLKIENVAHIECEIDEIPSDWVKILFTMDESQKTEITEFLHSKNYSDVKFVESFGYYYEMLPPGVSKGAAIRKMLDISGLGDKIVVTAGDYNNDIEMIEMADMGACVANAASELKEKCDIILNKTSDEGAIAELIDIIF